jgi:hypothetical protein
MERWVNGKVKKEHFVEDRSTFISAIRLASSNLEPFQAAHRAMPLPGDPLGLQKS